MVAALSGWKAHRLYLALDTTVLWDRALHDSPVGGLLWASGAVVVAGARAWECYRRIQGVQKAVTQSAVVVTASSRCDAPRAPVALPIMS